MTGVSKRRETWTQMPREDSHVKAEIQKPRNAKDSQKTTRREVGGQRHGMTSFSVSRKINLATILILDFWPLYYEKIHFCGCKP